MDMAEVKEFIRNSTKESAVYVGCDSQSGRHKGKRVSRFVTVVVIHKNSANGAKVFHRIDNMPLFKSNRERLMKEVELAVQIAYEISDVVGDRPFEVHLDINSKETEFSNVVIKEAVGWVSGMGFTARTKPDAFAATCAADKFTR